MNRAAIESRIRKMLPADLQASFDDAPSIDDEDWQAIFSRYCWVMMEASVTAAAAVGDVFDAMTIRKEALLWAAELRKLRYLTLQEAAAKRPSNLALGLLGFFGPAEPSEE